MPDYEPNWEAPEAFLDEPAFDLEVETTGQGQAEALRYEGGWE